jgi:hypothetical protein
VKAIRVLGGGNVRVSHASGVAAAPPVSGFRRRSCRNWCGRRGKNSSNRPRRLAAAWPGGQGRRRHARHAGQRGCLRQTLQSFAV